MVSVPFARAKRISGAQGMAFGIAPYVIGAGLLLAIQYLSHQETDMSKTVDKILELADKISATCEGESQYIMMCGLIEVTTSLLIDMDSDADHDKDGCPFAIYTNIMNRVLNSKLEMQELEDMDEAQETIH